MFALQTSELDSGLVCIVEGSIGLVCSVEGSIGLICSVEEHSREVCAGASPKMSSVRPLKRAPT